jgi:trimeric autotransporter adhesin
MSTINVDTVLPFTVGVNVVNVNGVKFDANSTSLQISNNNNAVTADNSLFVGSATGFTATGEGNTAVGYFAGFDLTSGTQNTLIGKNAGQNITTGPSNTIVGVAAGQLITTGQSNTLFGHNAGATITTGHSNVFIGSSAGSGISNITGQGNVCIGSGGGVNPSSSTAQFEFTLGNSFCTALRCAQTTITSLSDARDKKDVTDLRAGLDFINALRPVEFVWDDRDEEGRHDIADFGFIAQDLKAAQEDAEMAEVLKLVYESNPEKLEASYGKLLPILVKAVQELSAEVKALKAAK